jgi:hypothetical protein
LRESARKAAAGGSLLHQGTQSLGRAAGRRYIRQGDANASPPDEVSALEILNLQGLFRESVFGHFKLFR